MTDFWEEYADDQRRIIFAVGLALNAWQRVEAWHAGIYGLTSDERRQKKDMKTLVLRFYRLEGHHRPFALIRFIRLIG